MLDSITGLKSFLECKAVTLNLSYGLNSCLEIGYSRGLISCFCLRSVPLWNKTNQVTILEGPEI